MRACVTGATGFIGGPLVRRLLGESAEVRVLARPSARADALEAAGAKVERGDLADAAAIARAVEGADAVFHIAAKVNPPATKAEYFATNAGGTERILQASLARGARRVVYLSSISVYGLIEPGEKIDEITGYDAAPQFRDFYAQSKIAADRAAVTFAKSTGFPVAVLRPGLIYGPGRALPLGLLGFAARRTNVVFGKPEFRVPLNYTDNLIDAMLLAGSAEASGLREYIVVDDEDLTLAQYHAALSQFTKQRTRYFPGWPLRVGIPVAETFLRMLPIDASAAAELRQVRRAMQDRSYDTRRIREELGWRPRVSVHEGVGQTLRANEHSAKK